jgi:hypothetical protein
MPGSSEALAALTQTRERKELDRPTVSSTCGHSALGGQGRYLRPTDYSHPFIMVADKSHIILSTKRLRCSQTAIAVFDYSRCLPTINNE